MIREKLEETALKQGVKPWDIAKGKGIKVQCISKFMYGEVKNIGIENLQAVMDYLGLELVEKQNHSSLK